MLIAFLFSSLVLWVTRFLCLSRFYSIFISLMHQGREKKTTEAWERERRSCRLAFMIHSQLHFLLSLLSLNSLIHQGFIFLMKWIKEEKDTSKDNMRSLGHFSSFGIACLSFSFLSLEVSFGSLRERERETVDNFPEITRNRKKKRNESWFE